MKSPSYESLRDLSNELNDCAHFMIWANEKSGMQMNLHKIDNPEDGSAFADFYIFEETRGEHIGVVEYKRRNISFADANGYGGVYITKHKYDHLNMWAMSGKKSVLLCRFTDRLTFLSISDPHETRIDVGGTTKRKDPNDVRDMVYFINPDNWTTVPEGKFI